LAKLKLLEAINQKAKWFCLNCGKMTDTEEEMKKHGKKFHAIYNYTEMVSIFNLKEIVGAWQKQLEELLENSQKELDNAKFQAYSQIEADERQLHGNVGIVVYLETAKAIFREVNKKAEELLKL